MESKSPAAVELLTHPPSSLSPRALSFSRSHHLVWFGNILLVLLHNAHNYIGSSDIGLQQSYLHFWKSVKSNSFLFSSLTNFEDLDDATFTSRKWSFSKHGNIPYLINQWIGKLSLWTVMRFFIFNQCVLLCISLISMFSKLSWIFALLEIFMK